MQGINVPGVGSGLDVKKLVNQLVEAEGAPVKSRLNRKEAEIQSDISALGKFRSAIADFKSSLKGLRQPQDLQRVMAQSSNEEAVEVSASSEAAPGNYEISVKQLAQAHRLSSESFESDLAPVGTGTLTFQLGRYADEGQKFIPKADASVKTVEINQENSSLRGIVEAVNSAAVGVRASMINDGTGTRIVFTSEGTGEDNAIRLLSSDNDGNDSDELGLSRLRYDPVRRSQGAGGQGETTGSGASNLFETAGARNAELSIDGIAITSGSNTVGEAIKGLTLTLHEPTSSPVHITSELDKNGIVESVKGFVGKYNELMGVIQSLTGVDSQSGEAGPLAGDASIRSISSQLRRAITSAFGDVNENIVSLSSMGIDTQRNGSLQIDEGELNKAIDQHLDEVVAVLAKAGSSTDPLVRFDSAEEQTKAGAYELHIGQVATRGAYLGQAPTVGFPIRIPEGENTFRVNVDGVNSDQLTIPAGEYGSANELAAQLQRVINGDSALSQRNASVTVNLDAEGLEIVSNRFGSESQVGVSSASPVLAPIGLVPGKGGKGEDVSGTLGRLPADGSGQTLRGRGPADGIQVEVMGGKQGARGEVRFSRGVADQLDGMLQRFLGEEGVLATRQEGLSSKLEDISDERQQLARKLASTEQRLLNKYASLDATIGKMKKTSEFLSNQLSKLPGANSELGKDK